MKKLLLFIIVLAAFNCRAQVGWQWGKTVTHMPGVYSSVSEYYGTTVVDKSGNVYSTGYLFADSTLFGSYWLHSEHGFTQFFVTKLDSSGNYLWVKGTHNCNAKPISISVDSNECLYVYGYYYSGNCVFDTFHLINSTTSCMYFMAKISPAGNVLWAKNVCNGNPSGEYYGGYNISTDKYENIYLSGSFSGTSINIGSTTILNSDTSSSGFYTDMFIAKFDSLGNSIWAKGFGGRYFQNIQQMAVLSNGESYITLYTDSSFVMDTSLLISNWGPSPCHYFIAKFNPNGNIIWTKPIQSHIYPCQMKADIDENLYMTGAFDSSILLGGSLLSLTGSLNAFSVKFDSSGHVGWAVSGGGNNTCGWGLAIDSCSHLWVCGFMDTGYSMNFSGHVLSRPIGRVDPAFIVEYDNNGAYIQSMALTSGGDDASGIAIDNRGNFYFSGDYMGTSMTFGTDLLPYPIPEEVFFVAKYRYGLSCPTLESETINSGQAITLYPNPASRQINIDFGAANLDTYTVEFIDLTGRVLKTYTGLSYKASLSLAGMHNGLYTCKIVSSAGIVHYEKLVVMD